MDSFSFQVHKCRFWNWRWRWRGGESSFWSANFVFPDDLCGSAAFGSGGGGERVLKTGYIFLSIERSLSLFSNLNGCGECNDSLVGRGKKTTRIRETDLFGGGAHGDPNPVPTCSCSSGPCSGWAAHPRADSSRGPSGKDLIVGLLLVIFCKDKVERQGHFHPLFFISSAEGVLDSLGETEHSAQKERVFEMRFRSRVDVDKRGSSSTDNPDEYRTENSKTADRRRETRGD